MAETDLLVLLARRSAAFAKCYVSLTEALMAEGVREDVARQEARTTAATVVLYDKTSDEPCPVCGK